MFLKINIESVETYLLSVLMEKKRKMAYFSEIFIAFSIMDFFWISTAKNMVI